MCMSLAICAFTSAAAKERFHHAGPQARWVWPARKLAWTKICWREQLQRRFLMSCQILEWILPRLDTQKIRRPESAWLGNILCRIQTVRSNPNPSPKSKIQTPKSEIQNPKSEIQNPKTEIRNPKSKIQNPKSKIRNPKSKIRNPKSKIKSKIQNPKSKIQDPKSKIQNPKSKIQTGPFGAASKKNED